VCRRNTVEHPPGGWRRSDGTEQARFVAKRLQIADRVRAVCDRDGKIGEHRAREVDRHRLVGADEYFVPGVDQAGVSGEFPEQLGAGVGDHALAIRGYFDPCQSATTLHLESAFP